MTRTDPRTDGSLALRLDFGFSRPSTRVMAGSLRRLRLARSPDKYKVLEHRRRQAQIAARRLLEMMEEN